MLSVQSRDTVWLVVQEQTIVVREADAAESDKINIPIYKLTIIAGRQCNEYTACYKYDMAT